MAKKKKLDMKRIGYNVVGGVAGGVIGSTVTGMVEKQLVASGNVKAATMAPILSAIIGTIVTAVAPDDFKAVGIGMVAVAGGEVVEDAMQKKTPPIVQPPAASPVSTDAATNRINAASERVNPSNPMSLYYM